MLAKVGALLDCLATNGDLSPAEIAVELDEPRSSIYRLLASLQELGFVERTPRKTYQLGIKLFRLGSAVMAGFDERQIALPIMEKIHEATGETVFLCTRRGDDAVCIERLEGKRVQSLALKLGGSLPVHVGAAGQVLFAHAPEEFREHYVADRSLESFTPSTPTDPEQILSQARRVRRDGYAISDGDVTTGIAAVGAPIADFAGPRCRSAGSGKRSSARALRPRT
jgi:IclR family transcriptional regulator, acetate operon repressor